MWCDSTLHCRVIVMWGFQLAEVSIWGQYRTCVTVDEYVPLFVTDTAKVSNNRRLCHAVGIWCNRVFWACIYEDVTAEQWMCTCIAFSALSPLVGHQQHGWSNNGEGTEVEKERDRHPPHVRSPPTFQPWICFCRTHQFSYQRQTDKETCSICSNRTHLHDAYCRSKNLIL